MVRKCCFPGCRTNYNARSNGTRITGTCFKFPENAERRLQWLNIIGKQESFKTDNVGICISHFSLKSIKTHCSDNKTLLQKPQLHPNAIPSVMEEERQDSIDEVELTTDCDLIYNYKNLQENISSVVKNTWTVDSSDSFTTLFKLERSDNGDISVKCSISVSQYLDVQVFYKGNAVHKDFYNVIVPKTLKIQMFSQIDKLAMKCENIEQYISVNCFLSAALTNVTNALQKIESEGDEYKYQNVLCIIQDQIVQLLRKSPKFSTTTLIAAFMIHLQSATAYRVLRDKKILILPHPKTLSKLSNFQNIDPASTSSSMNYISKIAANLTENEKYVVLEIDEIYCNAQVNYKAQKLVGFAENKDELATTVMAFLVSSCFGPMKEVAQLIPTNSPKAINLQSYVNSILPSLQSIGLVVLMVLTDNNRINQSTFKLLAPDRSYKFINPSYEDRFIRVGYDSIHIVKNIRNSWLNKKSEKRSFFYPDFGNFKIVREASFQDLRDLYSSEVGLLIKKAPRLNKTTLYPNSFERQRVPLFLNIIHPTTISALRSFNRESTADFLEIIRQWYNIITNKSTTRGFREKDPSLQLISSPHCPQITFLKKFVSWLKAWRELGEDNDSDIEDEDEEEGEDSDNELLENKRLEQMSGGMTRDTFEAAIVTTQGIVDVAVECFDRLPIKFILLGKFVTDDLEKRFGRYRQLSGCTYNVTYRDILESEKKLRIKRLVRTFPLELHTQKYSKESVKEFDGDKYVSILETDFLERFTDNDHSSFMYVCGYGGHSISRSVNCQICRDLIIKGKGNLTEVEYFDHIQRGGLIVPTEICHLILLRMHAILNGITNDEILKRKFHISVNQQRILVYLTECSLRNDEDFVIDFQDKCLCGTYYADLFHPLMVVFSNILLKNMSKQINDEIVAQKKDASFEKWKKKQDTIRIKKAHDEEQKKLRNGEDSNIGDGDQTNAVKVEMKTKPASEEKEVVHKRQTMKRKTVEGNIVNATNNKKKRGGLNENLQSDKKEKIRVNPKYVSKKLKKFSI